MMAPLIDPGEVIAWAGLVVDRNQIGSNIETVFDSTSRDRESPTAMRESDAQIRKALKHAAENHRADGERCFRWHADQPRQPILRHSFFSNHVPGMDKNCSVATLRRAPDRIE